MSYEIVIIKKLHGMASSLNKGRVETSKYLPGIPFITPTLQLFKLSRGFEIMDEKVHYSDSMRNQIDITEYMYTKTILRK